MWPGLVIRFDDQAYGICLLVDCFIQRRYEYKEIQLKFLSALALKENLIYKVSIYSYTAERAC